jgi:hypothetical protein
MNYFDGRDHKEIAQKWLKHLNPKILKGRWSLQEDLKLCILVNYYGKKNWIVISKNFENRTDV